MDILFRKTIEQCRQLGARGGRAHAAICASANSKPRFSRWPSSNLHGSWLLSKLPVIEGWAT
jgi:hypothetical protein